MTASRKRASKEDFVVGSDSENLSGLNDEMKKRFGGKGLKRANQMEYVSLIETGCFDMDVASYGGFADHRLNQIKGPFSSGKTTTALQIARNAQRKYPDKYVIFIDSETHGDPLWIQKQGLDLDRLIIIDDLIFAEAYAEVFHEVLHSNAASVVILDSIATLTPKTEVDRSVEDHAKVAALATVVGKMCSSIGSRKQYCSQNNLHFPAIFFLNQQRDKIGGYAPNGIPQQIDNGGRFKDYCSTTILHLGKAKKVAFTDSTTGAKRTCIDQQTFQFAKCKSGTYTLKGEIEKVVSNAHPRLSVGQFDEALKVVKFAKKMGLIGGGGSKQTCVMWPDRFFAKQTDIALALEAEEEQLTLLKATIVAILRKENGAPMMPPDDYLMRHNGAEIQEIIDRLPNASV